MDVPALQNRCCCLDLETNEQGEIFAIGALFQDKTFQRKMPFAIQKVLTEFDRFAGDASYLLGHNLIQHDLPVCRIITPHLQFLNKPVIDTLFLSPLAFPENPYHRLVKNYKLVRDSLNDPLADARLADCLFQDQWSALQAQHKGTNILSFYHYVFSDNPQYTGILHALEGMGAKSTNLSQAVGLFTRLTKAKVCQTVSKKVLSAYLVDLELRPALAYCLAWLRVAGGNSVLPPWVHRQFHPVMPALRQLRDIPCNNPECFYCAQTHDPVTQLQRYFGFSAFRKKPPAPDGKSLQQAIVQSAMTDNPVFAILPTGGGKSLCFQLPALVRYQRRGLLTVIISPLQALMKDQVDNLRSKTGAPNAAALYGMLTAPERGDVLKGIQMGDIAILYVSPEQLRNRSFKQAVSYREIGCWVFDEAHCLSKWGHDFRPDYLYAARFIKEFAQQQHTLLPPIQCFTATAKQDVKNEIIDYFRANLGQELNVFASGVERTNLQFEVQTVNQADKYPRINTLLSERLGEDRQDGSAIIYCSTRLQTEAIADYLQHQGWQVEAFHAGKNVAEKKHIQENFIHGSTRVISATNAFGMGIDKEDVRLVIHADIPGSVENYLQEAGRAGRDQKDAQCILLYDEKDIETQFKLSAAAQLNQRDIAQILKGLRKSKTDQTGNVVLTAGELLQEDSVDTSFDNQDFNAATKVVTAVSWLERAGYVERNENRTQVFQGKPRVKNLDEARLKIAKLGLSQRQQLRWLAILEELFNADSDEGFSADDLAQLGEFSGNEDKPPSRKNETAGQRVIRTLYDMTEAGLIEKNMLLTAFVRYGGSDSSLLTLETVCSLERAMIKVLQEQAPDSENESWQLLSLRHLNQELLNQGYSNCNPDQLRKMLGSLSKDGRGLAGERGSINFRHQGQDQYAIKLQRGWKALTATAERRQAIAKVVLDRIFKNIPDGIVGSTELLVEFSAEDLLAALKQDLVTSAQVKDPLAAIERALNFLHEQRIITLQNGLAVFRQAMTIRILPEAKSRRYNKGDYEPLSQHYSERVFQVHVLNEYAHKALDKIGQALAFVVAYFSQDKTEFVKHYFSDRKEILERATSQQSFQRIVGDLHNPEQISLVAAHEDDNMLILAGPGSGKTRVVVHRCAYLLRVKRVSPRSLLVLCFNHNAAGELRRRLFDLIGDDAKGVTIQTYHGFSLRLTGHEVNAANAESGEYFTAIIEEAIALLRGEKQLLNMDADETRDRLLAGYRYILVDEYQDIDQLQYQLIAAITGRSLDEDSKLSILAVGDDDQNIYQFRGANIEFIRQFQQDYLARLHYLVENYRSSGNIIAASNQLIALNKDRMKTEHPIRINSGRINFPPGDRWQQLDLLARGRVQVISTANEQQQAAAGVAELLRLRQLNSRLDWSECAVLAREWRMISALRALMEENAIPFSLPLPSDRQPSPFRIRENALLLETLKNHPDALTTTATWVDFIDKQLQQDGNNPWWLQLQKLLQQWQQETCNASVPVLQTQNYLYETLAEQRRERRLGKGVFLSTVHSCKGMEFSHVIILDGGWTTQKIEEQRRLCYVAMTRAKETLCLMRRQDQNNPFLSQLQGDFMLRRQVANKLPEQCQTNRINYAILGLQDIRISFPAGFPKNHVIHRRLTDLKPGCSVTLENNNGKILIKYQLTVIAVLSKTANQYWLNKLDKVIRVSVIAMIRRYRDDSEEPYRSCCQVEQWEIPMLEVTYQS